MFRICLQHLFFDGFNKIPPDSIELADYLRDRIFLDYSATNWASHFLMSGLQADESTLVQMLALCSTSQTRFRVYWQVVHEVAPEGFTPLMIASYFGLSEVVSQFLGRRHTTRNDSDE